MENEDDIKRHVNNFYQQLFLENEGREEPLDWTVNQYYFLVLKDIDYKKLGAQLTS